jgi:hypothetical protein
MRDDESNVTSAEWQKTVRAKKLTPAVPPKQ